MIGRALLLALAFGFAARAASADEFEDYDRFFIGAGAELLLPQGGSRLHRVGGAVLRGGYYLSADVAVEGAAGWLEDEAELSLGALVHWQAFSLYGDLFGYSRFDPFFTLGAKGWIGREGQVGPRAGLGAFYHLTDSWALRLEADATLGLDAETAVDYSLSAGVQYSF